METLDVIDYAVTIGGFGLGLWAVLAELRRRRRDQRIDTVERAARLATAYGEIYGLTGTCYYGCSGRTRV